MNQMSKISIITPTFNCETYIEETIHSVQSQSYNNWEMILVDDCSSDQTVNIIKSLAQKDSRVKLIQLEQNSGAAIARNTAIKYATGRYIAFLDADDLWKSQKLEKQISFMHRYQYAFSYSYYDLISENGEPLNKTIYAPKKLTYQTLLYNNAIGCLTAIYDTQILGKVYMPNIRKRQDYGLWLKLLRKIPAAYCLPESLALYRVRKNSISRNKLGLLRYNYQLFREYEKLSIPRSFYLVTCNILTKISKSLK